MEITVNLSVTVFIYFPRESKRPIVSIGGFNLGSSWSQNAVILGLLPLRGLSPALRSQFFTARSLDELRAGLRLKKFVMVLLVSYEVLPRSHGLRAHLFPNCPHSEAISMVKVVHSCAVRCPDPARQRTNAFSGAAHGSGNITGTIADHAWGMDRTLSFSTQQTISLGGRRCELEEQVNC
jgi:hypothetical protein